MWWSSCASISGSGTGELALILIVFGIVARGFVIRECETMLDAMHSAQ